MGRYRSTFFNFFVFDPRGLPLGPLLADVLSALREVGPRATDLMSIFEPHVLALAPLACSYASTDLFLCATLLLLASSHTGGER